MMKRMMWLWCGIVSAVLITWCGGARSAHANSISYIDGRSVTFLEMNIRCPQVNSPNTKSTAKWGSSIYIDCNATTDYGGVFGLQYRANQAIQPGEIVAFTIMAKMNQPNAGRLDYYGLTAQDYTTLSVDVEDQYTSVDRAFSMYVVLQRNASAPPSDTLNIFYGNSLSTPMFEYFAYEGVKTFRVMTSSATVGKPVSGASLQEAIDNINKGLKIDADLSGLATSEDQQATTDAIEQGNQQAHEDAQEQLNWDKEQQQREEDGANNAADTQVNTGAESAEAGAKNSFNLFTAILTTPKTNCTLPEISAYGFSLGQLNLCTNQPPEWLRTIMGAVVSIVMAGGLIRATTRVLEELGRAY